MGPGKSKSPRCWFPENTSCLGFQRTCASSLPTTIATVCRSQFTFCEPSPLRSCLQKQHLYLCPPWGQGLHKRQFRFNLPWIHDVHSIQLCFTRPCGQGQHFAQLCFPLPWIQPLHLVQSFFAFPCGQPLQTSHDRFALPWGHGRQIRQLCSWVPCSQLGAALFLLGISPAPSHLLTSACSRSQCFLQPISCLVGEARSSWNLSSNPRRSSKAGLILGSAKSNRSRHQKTSFRSRPWRSWDVPAACKLSCSAIAGTVPVKRGGDNAATARRNIVRICCGFSVPVSVSNSSKEAT